MEYFYVGSFTLLIKFNRKIYTYIRNFYLDPFGAIARYLKVYITETVQCTRPYSATRRVSSALVFAPKGLRNINTDIDRGHGKGKSHEKRKYNYNRL